SHPLLSDVSGRHRTHTTQLCSAPASGTRTPAARRTLRVAGRNRARMRLLEPLSHDPRLPSACRHDAERLSPNASLAIRAVIVPCARSSHSLFSTVRRWRSRREYAEHDKVVQFQGTAESSEYDHPPRYQVDRLLH